MYHRPQLEYVALVLCLDCYICGRDYLAPHASQTFDQFNILKVLMTLMLSRLLHNIRNENKHVGIPLPLEFHSVLSAFLLPARTDHASRVSIHSRWRSKQRPRLLPVPIFSEPCHIIRIQPSILANRAAMVGFITSKIFGS